MGPLRNLAGVRVWRGEELESLHAVAAAVVDGRGRTLHRHGDPERRAWLRSSAKPIQLLPLVEEGLIERFGAMDPFELSSEMRYQIVQDRGIPISGNAASQKARVTSPMNGVVIKRGVELGQTVTSGVSSFNEGTALFTVADLKSLIIRVNLNEVDIAKVEVGQPVRITLDAYPQKVFTGKVTFVAPAAELVEKIKVFKVEIGLDELGAHFKTGMSANVEILGTKRDKAVSIPLEALQRREGDTVAFRLKSNLKPQQISAAQEGLSGRNKFIWLSDHWKEYYDVVPVKAGVATLERVEILAGLKPGEQVSLEDPTKKKIEKDEED